MKYLLMVMLLLASCSSYISKIHQKLDEDEGRSAKAAPKDKFQFFRNQKSVISSQDFKVLPPPVERQYQDEGERKRYVESDLNDNSNEGSLWYGHGQENFFFAKNKNRRAGDIISLKVMNHLKKEIALELGRSFPILKLEKKGDKATATATATPPATPSSEEKREEGDEKTVYDQISCVIAEEVSKDHILLRGRKDVLYRNRKRLVEVQALIPIRDIQDDDTVTSTSIIESTVAVLR